jgi:cobalt-zinc-cadmium efflux system protein
MTLHSNSHRLGLALILTLAFVLVETAGGLAANSLALLSDAAHNLTDVFALGLSWYALRLARRPANARKTFGYHRAGILAALVNSASLAAIAALILYEAYERLRVPQPVDAPLLMGVGALAFIVNTVTALLLHRDAQTDLNIKSAFVHLAGDAVSTLGALLAGVGIALTGWVLLDPLAGILIALLILVSAWSVGRETLDILLEAAPKGLDLGTVMEDMLRVPGVQGVHDLHVWSISSNLRTLSAHILTDDVALSGGSVIRRDLHSMLASKYQITHSALQLECEDCETEQPPCGLNHTRHSSPLEEAR